MQPQPHACGKARSTKMGGQAAHQPRWPICEGNRFCVGPTAPAARWPGEDDGRVPWADRAEDRSGNAQLRLRKHGGVAPLDDSRRRDPAPAVIPRAERIFDLGVPRHTATNPNNPASDLGSGPTGAAYHHTALLRASYSRIGS